MKSLLFVALLLCPTPLMYHIDLPLSTQKDFVYYASNAGVLDAHQVGDMCERLNNGPSDLPFNGFVYAMHRRLVGKPCQCCDGCTWDKKRRALEAAKKVRLP